MKQLTLFRLAGIAIALFTTTTGFAQVATTKPARPEAMINLGSSISDAADDLTVLENLKNTSERLYRNFTRRFAGANDIHVFPNEKTTVLYCKVEGIQNNILFSNKGAWIHTVRYYTPDLLPNDVSSMVQAAFPGYTLTRVAEVSTNAGTAYLVDIDTKTQFKTIRVVNGEWDIYQEYFKQ